MSTPKRALKEGPISEPRKNAPAHITPAAQGNKQGSEHGGETAFGESINEVAEVRTAGDVAPLGVYGPALGEVSSDRD